MYLYNTIFAYFNISIISTTPPPFRSIAFSVSICNLAKLYWKAMVNVSGEKSTCKFIKHLHFTKIIILSWVDFILFKERTMFHFIVLFCISSANSIVCAVKINSVLITCKCRIPEMREFFNNKNAKIMTYYNQNSCFAPLLDYLSDIDTKQCTALQRCQRHFFT